MVPLPPAPEAAAAGPLPAAPRPEAAGLAPVPEAIRPIPTLTPTPEPTRPIPALTPSAEPGRPGTAAGPPLPEAAGRPAAGVPAAETVPVAAPPAVERTELPRIVPANVTGPAVEPVVVPIPVYTPPRSGNPEVASGQDIVREWRQARCRGSRGRMLAFEPHVTHGAPGVNESRRPRR